MATHRRPTMRAARAGLGTLAVVLALVSISSVARAAALPPVLQAALIAKIFQADETLRTRHLESTKMLLVVTRADAELADALEQALVPTRIETVRLGPSDVGRIGDGTAAVYVTPGAVSDALGKASADHGVLSIAGDAALAEAGQVAVALSINKDNRPEIVINTRRLSAERHVLAQSVMRLARLVEDK